MAVKINGSTGITFEDNDKENWGTGNDLEIYHDASNSYIDETGTGSLILRASPSIELRKAGGTEKMLYAEPDAQVELYYDNVKKLETTSTGVKATGSGNLLELDGGNAAFSLQLKETSSAYHRLGFQKSGHLLQLGEFNNAGDTFTEIMKVDAANNVFGAGDDIKLNLGDGADLKIYHDGSTAKITNATGTTYFGADDLRFTDAGITATHAIIDTNGLHLDTTSPSASNGLNDYEEGTFDCKMITNSGTYPTQTTAGYYRKIGTSVTIHGQIQFAATNGSGTGLVWIELPFNVTGGRGGIALGIVSGFEWSAGHQLFLAAEINSQALYALETEPNSAGHTHLTPASVKNAGSSLFSFGGTYVSQ